MRTSLCLALLVVPALLCQAVGVSVISGRGVQIAHDVYHADDMVGYWAMEETGTRLDSQGDNDLLETDAAVVRAEGGLYGYFAYLKYRDDPLTVNRLGIADGSAFNASSTVAVVAWINGDITGVVSQFVTRSGCWILDSYSSGGTQYFRFKITESDDDVVTAPVANKATCGYSLTAWNCFIGIASGGRVRLFINGSEIGTGTAYDGSIKTGTGALSLGYVMTDPGDTFIDEVCIFPDVSFSSEVDLHGFVVTYYNGGIGITRSQFP